MVREREMPAREHVERVYWTRQLHLPTQLRGGPSGAQIYWLSELRKAQRILNKRRPIEVSTCRAEKLKPRVKAPQREALDPHVQSRPWQPGYAALPPDLVATKRDITQPPTPLPHKRTTHGRQ